MAHKCEVNLTQLFGKLPYRKCPLARWRYQNKNHFNSRMRNDRVKAVGRGLCHSMTLVSLSETDWEQVDLGCQTAHRKHQIFEMA